MRAKHLKRAKCVCDLMKGRTLPELLLHLLHLLLLLLVWHFGDAVVMVSLSHGNDSLLLQSVFIVLVHALSLLSICFHAFNFFFVLISSYLDFCWLAGHDDDDSGELEGCGRWRREGGSLQFC